MPNECTHEGFHTLMQDILYDLFEGNSDSEMESTITRWAQEELAGISLPLSPTIMDGLITMHKAHQDELAAFIKCQLALKVLAPGVVPAHMVESDEWDDDDDGDDYL
jgi:hypothetical protein